MFFTKHENIFSLTPSKILNQNAVAGNTPAHLVLIEGVEIAASDSLYTASMEGMVDTGALATITSLAISQVEQVQLCVLVFLFSRGARDTVNFYGQGVADLLEQGDMTKVFMEMVSRGRGEGQEHQYEEISETAQEAATLDRGEEAAAAAPATAATATTAKECLICSEVLPLAIFLPCNHQVSHISIQRCTFDHENQVKNKIKSNNGHILTPVIVFMWGVLLKRSELPVFAPGHSTAPFHTDPFPLHRYLLPATL